MADNVATPFHETSDVTFRAVGDVKGKTFVVPTSDRTSGPGLSDTPEGSNYRMKTAVAGGAVAGVARYDVDSGELGGVIGTPGRIVPVVAGGSIAAGEQVEVGADGKAVKLSSGVAVGLCMNGADSAEEAEIRLY